MAKPHRRRDWALALSPQGLAGRPEGWVFALLSTLVILLVAVADISTPRNPTVAAITYLPLLACGWFLSRRLTMALAALAIALQALTAQVGAEEPATALAAVVGIVVVTAIGRLAATSVLRSHQIERRSLRVSELERAKSDFLRLASHELRGPVAVVRGYLNMLEEGALGELPERAREAVPVMVGRMRSMSLLIDQMLDVARLEDSRLQLTREHHDLHQVVRETCDELRHLATEAHRIEVVDPERPVIVLADRARVCTIIGNLVENAIKYSPEGGRICCRTFLEGKTARVTVADQGMGISDQGRASLFTRFGRVVTEGTQHIGGTGLGLYISRELARMHGGDLTVESREGVGSTFSLSIPVGPPAAAPVGAAGKAKTLRSSSVRLA